MAENFHLKASANQHLIIEVITMAQAKWKSFTEEQLQEIVANSSSNREVARKLGYNENGGGTMTALKKMYEEMNLDTSHFKGQGWNKGNYDYSTFAKGEVKRTGKTIVEPLIALRGRKCENCGIEEWLGQPIKLEAHHIDGDRLNNEFDNLQLLCPNCHSYTETYCAKRTEIIVEDEIFAQALKDSPNIRQALIKLGLTPKGGNYTRARELIEKYQISHLYK